ncbi:MFS transporter [Actinomadura sp. NAK00032]|uniref:MFS transporter n=1 Tax=Actinomadura sp. NAK00032 TaxID=2742128 RepID=UPI00159186A4|nr:MFS transporter [Actinomadura sp. NAK00032]QKW35530.1 MFS transporter [Actinomadura sp. NAK00032]
MIDPIPTATRRPLSPPGWWPLAAIVAAVFMLMLDATVVTVALARMRDDLHAGLGDLQWVMNGYTLAMAAFQLTAGSLADRWGRRRSFLTGVALFTAASLACGLAPNAAVLITMRVVQGLAGALMFATTLALIAQCYTGRRRGLAFGVRGMAAGSAVVLGPVVGGALVSGPGWRWIFLVNVPAGALTLAIGAAALPRHEPARTPRRIDALGPFLLAVALTALVFTLLRGEDQGWGSARTLTTSVAALVALLLFTAVEHRRRDPMLDLSLFRDRVFTGTQVGSFTVQASIFAMLVYVSLWFQDGLHYTALKTGLCFLPLVVPILLAGPLAGAIMDRLPKGLLVSASLAVLAAAIVLMRGSTAWTDLAPGMLLAGLACGVALPTLGALAVDIPDERHLGMASGVNNTVLQIGFAVGIAAYGAVASQDTLFLIGAASALTGAAITALLMRS